MPLKKLLPIMTLSFLVGSLLDSTLKREKSKSRIAGTPTLINFYAVGCASGFLASGPLKARSAVNVRESVIFSVMQSMKKDLRRYSVVYMHSQPYALHWFRRDLRVAGNPSLKQLREDYAGRVVGIFCFDRKFLGREDFSHNRFQFFLNTLSALRDEMRSLGSDLLFCDIGPDAGFAELFEQLREQKQALPETVGWCRDYEPFAIDRDQRLQLWLHGQGCRTATERDHVLIEAHEIVKDSKPREPYQVYTPFAKKWRTVFGSREIVERIQSQKPGLRYLEQGLKAGAPKPFCLSWGDLVQRDAWKVFDDYDAQNRKKVTVPLPAAGSYRVHFFACNCLIFPIPINLAIIRETSLGV